MIFLVNMLNIVAAECGNRNEHNTDTEEFKNKVAQLRRELSLN